MEVCSQCKTREVEFVIKGGICENCWIDWMCEVYDNPRDQAEARRELRKQLKSKSKRKGKATIDHRTQKWVEKQNKAG